MKQSNKKLVNLVDLVKNNFVETIEENGNAQSETNKTENVTNISELSLEEQAALELLNASKKNDKKEDIKRIIEIDKDKFIVEGEKESSIDDYENVPIDEFGKAMLRGMGWKDGCGIGKNEKLVKVVQPAIRPKGMGLGADKITKQDPNNKPAVDKDGKVLKCVKRAFVKIIAGYHKGSYGQIMGLDDESGRFIIKTAINNLNISLNEFLVVPVTKEEYNKNSRIINNAKYEEYMKKKEEEKRLLDENNQQKKYVKKERKSESSDAEEGTSRRNKSDKIKKYSDSNSDDDTYKNKQKDDKHRRKNDNDEKKYKEKQRSIKYEEEENRKKSRDRKNKYDSEEEYKRDRKKREKKSKKYSSDVSDSEDEDEKKYKKSSKRDEDYSKKKNKKKKSKKYSSDDSEEERYKKRKSKKNEKKHYSDSEDEDKHGKSHRRDKKEKGRYERDTR